MSALAFNQEEIKCINFECLLHDGIESACALHCLTNSVSFSPSLLPVLFSFSLPIPLPLLSLLTLCQLCFLSLILSNSPLHALLSSFCAPCFSMGDHIRPPCVPPMTQRGSSDAVCSPRSARLLLYSWSGLEIPHYSGLSPSHHGLLPRPPEPAERLHGGLLWPAPRSWHWQVWPAPSLYSPVLKEQVMEEDRCSLYKWMIDC